MIHLIRFFSIEKEYSFHMGLKTEWPEFECFIYNVLLRHFINEFIRIMNWNNLNETFQAYRKNYSIVTREVRNSRVTKSSCETELLNRRLNFYCFTFELLTPRRTIIPYPTVEVKHTWQVLTSVGGHIHAALTFKHVWATAIQTVIGGS